MKSVPTRTLRERPDLHQLKGQAKELLEAYRASSPEAVAAVTDCPVAAGAETWATLKARTQKKKHKTLTELLGPDAESPCSGGSVDASVR